MSLSYPSQRSTCSKHRAINAANIDQRHLAATGVGATSCARHYCFVPNSVVDFQKGERSVDMDRHRPDTDESFL